MLRRVEDQRRVKNGEAERREDLNEEQRGRSLRSRGEKAFERFHPVAISPAAPCNVKPLAVLRPLTSDLCPTLAAPDHVKPAHDARGDKASRQLASGDPSRFVIARRVMVGMF
jgi:hypothetical protein